MSRRSLQLYREQAAYLERVCKWVEKVGLEKIRAAIMDDHDGRRALFERFLKSQRAVRKDPWAERAAGRELHEFTPLAMLNSIEPRSPPNERRHETIERLLVRRRAAERDPAARRAHREDAAPRDRGLPHRERRGVRARKPCPHKGGPLSEGIVHGRKVACPLHNWIINLEDGEATGADKGCARSFPVKIENGRIYLDMSVAAAP